MKKFIFLFAILYSCLFFGQEPSIVIIGEKIEPIVFEADDARYMVRVNTESRYNGFARQHLPVSVLKFGQTHVRGLYGWNTIKQPLFDLPIRHHIQDAEPEITHIELIRDKLLVYTNSAGSDGLIIFQWHGGGYFVQMGLPEPKPVICRTSEP